MQKITRRVFLAGGAAMAAVAVGELGSGRTSLAQGGTVNLYSARHYDTDSQLYSSFTSKTGIKVNLVQGSAEELLERIKSEGANSPADVLITVDAGNLWRVDSQGLFQPVSSQVLQAIPGNLRHPQGHWFGLSMRARAIMYNKNKVNPAQLSTYEDLAAEKWRGKILIRSSSNVYNQSLVASLIAVHGAQKTEQWARGLMANFARPPEGNDTAQITACAAGVGDIAIANSYYLVRLAKSSNPQERAIADRVGMFFPNQRDRGTHVNISGAGVLKYAPNKAGAIKFIEHMASTQAQQIFASGNNEYPVISGVPLDSVLQRYGTFKSDPINVASLGSNNSEAIKIMDRVGWK
ncbi:Fe(3+) ABC transporter substrate-binding protein [[Phormidium] sp. ETS-05]|uniref:Fe(3+) ABC transporter substrate-binding protein n=1 Tax=[Phormidium] sp. ETS-05 TaxID=222819 RepID=UPI0018EF2275|nr:Fe(3+) ABC transporter substrate-binding protein [[Phormidium] sp. ETS-05]